MCDFVCVAVAFRIGRAIILAVRLRAADIDSLWNAMRWRLGLPRFIIFALHSLDELRFGEGLQPSNHGDCVVHGTTMIQLWAPSGLWTPPGVLRQSTSGYITALQMGS